MEPPIVSLNPKPIPQTTSKQTESATPTQKLLDKTEFPKKTPRGTRSTKRKSGYWELKGDDRKLRSASRSTKPDRTSRSAPSEIPKVSQPRTSKISAELERRFRELEKSQKDSIQQARVGGELKHLAVSKNSAGQF